MLVDSHCHLDFPDYTGKIAEILAEMRASQVTHALCISVNLEGFANVLRLAEENANLYATVGVHPDQLPDVPGAAASAETLLALSRHPKVVAIGETGLDYHWVKGDAEWQRERFRVHIRAARLAGKPLVVHTREAAADTLRIMREEGAEQVGGVMHCFTETLDTAFAAVDMNFFVSFSGIVTFKNAADLREVARALPMDRLLVETDSPFLAPVPHRGKTNRPAWVRHVAEEVAKIRGMPFEAVAEATTANFCRLFGLTLTGQPSRAREQT
ncbi:MAG: TatD family deoxyribonuclease [Betaproteobacteria bacterium]|nr:TatD family deoxyribonuclease [Betaproteobacteria bacterium]